MSISLPTQERLRSQLPELQALPDGWIATVDEKLRFYFVDPATRKTHYAHPTLGNLPKPWVLRLCSIPEARERRPRYYNLETRESTTENPRMSNKVLRANNNSWKRDDLSTAANFSRMKKAWSLNNMKRQPIGNVNIRHKYDILKALDPGDGTVGGMNGGVFVVRLRGQERLSVEKR
jgi:NIMA (never in mitosis gene a)-related kinase